MLQAQWIRIILAGAWDDCSRKTFYRPLLFMLFLRNSQSVDCPLTYQVYRTSGIHECIYLVPDILLVLSFMVMTGRVPLVGFPFFGGAPALGSSFFLLDTPHISLQVLGRGSP